MRERPNSQHGFFRQCVWVVFNAFAVVALAACGGGGGGDDPPAPPVTNPPPSNAAPTANAGADQTVQLPNTATLTGSATDDGLPSGSSLSYAWSTTATGVTFGSANAATTTAQFAAEGSYTLVLTVSDGALSDTDEVVVTVQAAGSANQPPTVDAGDNQTVSLPATTARLVGSATDDNPNSTLTYTWSSTATGVSIATPNAAETDVTLPAAAGSYVFTLTVSDGALEGTGTVTVTVTDPAVALVFPGPDGIEDPTGQSPHGWELVAPADEGMDVAFLDRARDYSLVGGTGGLGMGGSGLISRRGRMVYRWGNIDDRYQLKSATKSVGGIALGLALTDSRLALTDAARTHLPTLGEPQNAGNPELANITVAHLATHIAGFEKEADDPLLEAAPATRWKYSDGGVDWLADVLTQLYAKDLNTELKTRVWDVLQITGDDLTWRVRPASEPHPGGFPRREFSSGMSMNTNAMARIGLLFLARGNWNGTTVFNADFADIVGTPRDETKAVPVDPAEAAGFPAANERYGLLWWTNETGALPAPVPADTYWAWGLGDSLIVVIPSLNLVIARTGNDPDIRPHLPKWRDSWNGQYDVLVDFIKPIVCSTMPTDANCQ
jgi:CubicO group peptidase (beta-lactamase class C family)